MWRMRTKGEITYSKIYGQYFYTIGAIRICLTPMLCKVVTNM
ncbi:hypothetical protein KRR40_02760 [Niabella defluvii]|nr:hypothetical protein KRR40_02760 [Niabella sp. I65]